jgi:hypothetical protein
MCGSPERLTAFGARNFLVLSQQSWITKYRLINPLNLGELYAA